MICDTSDVTSRLTYIVVWPHHRARNRLLEFPVRARSGNTWTTVVSGRPRYFPVVLRVPFDTCTSCSSTGPGRPSLETTSPLNPSRGLDKEGAFRPFSGTRENKGKLSHIDPISGKCASCLETAPGGASTSPSSQSTGR